MRSHLKGLMMSKNQSILQSGDMEAFMDHQIDCKQTNAVLDQHLSGTYQMYLRRWHPSLAKTKKQEMQDANTNNSCKECGGGLRVDGKQNVLLCCECGVVSETGVAVSMMTVKPDQLCWGGRSIIKKHLYERIVIYKRCMTRIQGMCNLEPREDEIKRIKPFLELYDILRPVDVAYQARRLKIRNLRGYEYTLAEKFDASGTFKTHKLTFDQHCKHLVMFAQCELAFVNMKRKRDTNRCNFMGYAHFYSMVNEELGLLHLNEYVMLFKGDKVTTESRDMFMRLKSCIN